MRRLEAFLALISMLAAPLALVARGQACASACAKSCCLISSSRVHASPQADANCHSQRPADSRRCGSAPAPNHALDFGFLAPLPRVILPALTGAPSLQTSRRAISPAVLNDSSINLPPPAEPPRS